MTATIPRDVPVYVRVNSALTPWFEEDLGVARTLAIRGVLLPKADSAAHVERALAAIAPEHVDRPDHRDRGRDCGTCSTSRRCPRVERIVFGALDFTLDTGIHDATARSMPCAPASSSRRRSPASRRRWISSRSRSTIPTCCDATPLEAGASASAASCAFIRSRSRSRTTHSGRATTRSRGRGPCSTSCPLGRKTLCSRTEANWSTDR